MPALNILEYARTAGKGVRVLAVGSGDVYGAVAPEDLPLAETRPPRPANPYALSKAIQEQVCAQYASAYGVDVVVTRSFNHTGPGQRDTFVLPSFARQIVEMRLGLREPGSTSATSASNGTLPTCGTSRRRTRRSSREGRGRGVQRVLRRFVRSPRSSREDVRDRRGHAGDPRGRIEASPRRGEELRGDPSKVARDTGWRASTPIEATLESLVEYWSRSLSGAAT